MNQQLTVVFSIAILLSVTVVASVDLLQTADAAKAKGNYLPETGSKKVCGDKLCSEIPPEERQSMKQKITSKSDLPSQTSLNDIMDRMDKVHEQHQTQMMSVADNDFAGTISNDSENESDGRKNGNNGYDTTHEHDGRHDE